MGGELFEIGTKVLVRAVTTFAYDWNSNRIMTDQNVKEFEATIVGGAIKYLGKVRDNGYDYPAHFTPSKQVRLYRVRTGFFSPEKLVNPIHLTKKED